MAEEENCPLAAFLQLSLFLDPSCSRKSCCALMSVTGQYSSVVPRAVGNWERHSPATCFSFGNFFCWPSFLTNVNIFSFCSLRWFLKIFLPGNLWKEEAGQKQSWCFQCWTSRWGFGPRGMSWAIGICSSCMERCKRKACASSSYVACAVQRFTKKRM